MEHGDSCVGELIKYKMEAFGNQVQCKNKANTCERSLCECDNLLGPWLYTLLGYIGPNLTIGQKNWFYIFFKNFIEVW